MIVKHVGTLLAIAVLSGNASQLCAETGNSVRLEGAARAYMQDILKDPDSAQWQLVKAPFPETRGGQSGYAVCYQINAKNSYGGYTGYKTHYFLISDGNVVFHAPKEAGISPELASIEQQLAQAFCQ